MSCNLDAIVHSLVYVDLGHGPVPPYSTDLTAAWDLVDEMEARGCTWKFYRGNRFKPSRGAVWSPWPKGKSYYRVSFQHGVPFCDAVAATLPEAIVGAVILALDPCKTCLNSRIIKDPERGRYPCPDCTGRPQL